MSELIDREAVREFIKSYRHSTDVAFDMEDHLDEIPTAPRWHRVEDQLPEPGQDVLVYTYLYGRSIYAVAWLDNEGKWSFGTVTHWMPIVPAKEENIEP